MVVLRPRRRLVHGGAVDPDEPGAHRQHSGAFEQAHGGTIFLDEIGELPLDLQAHLLGVLERKSFRRVGGRDPIEVDVRVVAASNRDLRKAVNSGAFRLDLYYRLAVVRLQVPPLRERLDDVPLLVEHFLRESGFDGEVETLVAPDAMQALMQHHWQGNVRELRNYVQARLAMGDSLCPDDEPAGLSLPPAGGAEPLRVPFELGYSEAREVVLRQFEVEYLRRLLELNGGNVSRTARDAGLARSYVNMLIKRHQLR